jgi:hypothetical protein
LRNVIGGKDGGVELALDHVIVAVPNRSAAAEARRGLRAVPGGRT